MTQSQLTHCGPLNQHYLNRIERTLRGALEIHPRLTVIRVDLRLPNNGIFSDDPMEWDTPTLFANTNPNLISRFIASLKAQIKAEYDSKQREGVRVHPCELNHVWVREYSQEHKEHYHLALMVNKDRYFSLGNYNMPGGLAWMIKKAWASALGLSVEHFYTLVNIPQNPIYTLNHNAPHDEFVAQLSPLLKRLSYLAKEKTKVYGTDKRNFGCSDPKKKWK